MTTIKIIMSIHFISNEDVFEEDAFTVDVGLGADEAAVDDVDEAVEGSPKERVSAREFNGDDSLLGGSDSSKRFMYVF